MIATIDVIRQSAFLREHLRGPLLRLLIHLYMESEGAKEELDGKNDSFSGVSKTEMGREENSVLMGKDVIENRT